jgi:hypothetical protein
MRVRRAKNGRVGGELIEKRPAQKTRARELDEGALAAGEYALHWMSETTPSRCTGPVLLEADPVVSVLVKG